jgi:hypothetical protein
VAWPDCLPQLIAPVLGLDPLTTRHHPCADFAGKLALVVVGNAPHVPDLVEELLLGLNDLRQRPRLLFADQELDFSLLFQVRIPELLEQHLYLVSVARSDAAE